MRVVVCWCVMSRRPSQGGPASRPKAAGIGPTHPVQHQKMEGCMSFLWFWLYEMRLIHMKILTHVLTFFHVYKPELCNLRGAPSLSTALLQEKSFERGDDPCSQRHKSFQSKLDEALASWCTDVHAGGCGSACAESRFSLFYSGYGSFPPLRGRIWSLILCVPLHKD